MTDSRENELMKLHAELIIFHMKGFALGLVLKQRHEITRKWPIIRNRAVFICRKIIDFALPYFMPHDWLQKNTRNFQPNRSINKTNCESF